MAGVGDRVQILVGLASAKLPEGAKLMPQADLIFLDHAKPCYTPDLQQMEALGMVVPGSWVVADNVIHPGAPGFLEHVVPANGYSRTVLLEATFEYEEPWRINGGGPKADALSLSEFTGHPEQEGATEQQV